MTKITYQILNQWFGVEIVIRKQVACDLQIITYEVETIGM